MDAYDQNSSYDSTGLSLDLIEEEIEQGLVNHAGRLACAFDNEEFYQGRNAAYIKRRQSEEWLDYLSRPKRTSKLTRKVIRKLAENLYSPGPTRKVGAGADVDKWLSDVYTANHVNALWQQADRKASLNGCCAIQVTGTGRPEKPIQLSLWGAHEFVAWPFPDDPTEAWAVCTIARERQIRNGRQEERLRLEVWSRDEHRVYFTKYKEAVTWPDWNFKNLFGIEATYIPQLSGDPAESGKNPYGTLPFTLISDELPVSTLYEGGIGTALRECNEELDRELSDLAQIMKAYMAPDGFLVNVGAAWRNERRIGGYTRLTPGKNAEGDAGGEPKAFFVQPQLATQEAWFNITQYANNTLEDLDVPISAIRADANADSSGIAIVAKLIPLLTRARERQAPFTKYEGDVCKMILTAAGNFYNEPRLLAAAVDPKLSLLWPEPAFPMPTPERDQADEWEMGIGAKSLIDIVAERLGVTRDQALEQIKQVQADNEKLKSILPPPEPAPVPPEDAGQADAGGDQEPQPGDDQNAA